MRKTMIIIIILRENEWKIGNTIKFIKSVEGFILTRNETSFEKGLMVEVECSLQLGSVNIQHGHWKICT